MTSCLGLLWGVTRSHVKRPGVQCMWQPQWGKVRLFLAVDPKDGEGFPAPPRPSQGRSLGRFGLFVSDRAYFSFYGCVLM